MAPATAAPWAPSPPHRLRSYHHRSHERRRRHRHRSSGWVAFATANFPASAPRAHASPPSSTQKQPGQPASPLSRSSWPQQEHRHSSRWSSRQHHHRHSSSRGAAAPITTVFIVATAGAPTPHPQEQLPPPSPTSSQQQESSLPSTPAPPLSPTLPLQRAPPPRPARLAPRTGQCTPPSSMSSVARIGPALLRTPVLPVLPFFFFSSCLSSSPSRLYDLRAKGGPWDSVSTEKAYQRLKTL